MAPYPFQPGDPDHTDEHDRIYDELAGLAANYVGAGAFIRVAPNESSIRTAAQALYAAGGGTVLLPPATIALTSPLPILRGVTYKGIPPVQTQTVVTPGAYLADAAPTFSGGTVFTGNGTFAAFEANVTDLAAPTSTVGADQIGNVGLYGFGLDGFTYGIRVGARNVMGLVWSSIDQVYIKNCSAWGIYLANFVHCDIGLIETALCQNGQYYAARMDGTVYQGGNSHFRELYHLIPQDARDRRLCRGIVFEAQGGTGSNGGALNECNVLRAQVNSYNKTLLSVSAGLTNTSTSVTVPDGSLFLPGMVVSFTTTANGFTTGIAYVVLTVAGNVLTLAQSRNATAITAAGTGSMTLTTYGFPCVEITAADSASHVTSTHLKHIDAEGTASAALYIEGAQRSEFTLTSIPNVTLVDVIGRGVSYSVIQSSPPASTDFDASSTSSEFNGARKTGVQRLLRGRFYDSTLAVHSMQVGAGQNGVTTGDLQSRAQGFLYPTVGLGDRIFPRDSAITLSAQNAGDLIFAGSAGQVWTLPTILTDTSNPSASQVGAVFDIFNVGSGTITLNTDGTQTFNKVVGRTSTTVTPGNRLRVVGAKDNSGNLFWAAAPSTLLA